MGVVVVKPGCRDVTTLPAVTLRVAPLLTFEVIAIGAGLFALVLTVLLYLSSEVVWSLVLLAAVHRRLLLENGLDVVLTDRVTSRRLQTLPLAAHDPFRSAGRSGA